eukprot:gnl/Carplike_NY0171/3182_a4276_279.p1 GENE.gnl/Carplike_NY0171/3182_a4276_279~~gnl/Carplike_NY0171/3182_a4276_279.p1  ORF type:complete len:1850 (-),score=456.04 gnl/Carplike_NY0171/3182_a4276_279:1011-6068(-)
MSNVRSSNGNNNRRVKQHGSARRGWNGLGSVHTSHLLEDDEKDIVRPGEMRGERRDADEPIGNDGSSSSSLSSADSEPASLGDRAPDSENSDVSDRAMTISQIRVDSARDHSSGSARSSVGEGGSVMVKRSNHQLKQQRSGMLPFSDVRSQGSLFLEHGMVVIVRSQAQPSKAALRELKRQRGSAIEGPVTLSGLMKHVLREHASGESNFTCTPLILSLFKKSVRVCVHERDIEEFVRRVDHCSHRGHVIVSCSVRTRNLEDTFLLIERIEDTQRKVDEEIMSEGTGVIEGVDVIAKANRMFTADSSQRKVRKELSAIRNRQKGVIFDDDDPYADTDEEEDEEEDDSNESSSLGFIRLKALIKKHVSSSIIQLCIVLVSSCLLLVVLLTIFNAGDKLNATMQITDDYYLLERGLSACVSWCRGKYNSSHEDSSTQYDDSTILSMCLQERYDGWTGQIDYCTNLIYYFPVSVDISGQRANQMNSFFNYDNNEVYRVYWSSYASGVIQLLESRQDSSKYPSRILNDIGTFYNTSKPSSMAMTNIPWSINNYGDYWSENSPISVLRTIRAMYDKYPDLFDPHCDLGSSINIDSENNLNTFGIMAFLSGGFYWQFSQEYRQITSEILGECYDEVYEPGMSYSEISSALTTCRTQKWREVYLEYVNKLAYQRFEFILQDTLPSCTVHPKHSDKCITGETISVEEFHEDIFFSQDEKKSVGITKYSDWAGYDGYFDAARTFPVAGLEVNEYGYFLPEQGSSGSTTPGADDLEFSFEYVLHTYLPHYLVRRYTRLETQTNVFTDVPYSDNNFGSIGEYAENIYYPPIHKPKERDIYFQRDTDIIQPFPYIFDTITDLTARLVTAQVAELTHIRSYLQSTGQIAYPTTNAGRLECGKHVLFGSEEAYDEYIASMSEDELSEYSDTYLLNVPACSELPAEISPASITIEGEGRRLPEKMRESRPYLNFSLLFLTLIVSFFVVIITIVILMDVATNTNKGFLKLHGINISLLSCSGVIFIVLSCLVLSILLSVLLPALVGPFNFSPSVDAEANLENAIERLEQSEATNMEDMIDSFETFIDLNNYSSMSITSDLKFWNKMQGWLSSFLVIFLSFLMFVAFGLFISSIVPSEEQFMSIYVFLMILGILGGTIWAALYNDSVSLTGILFFFFFVFPPFTMTGVFTVLSDLSAAGFYPFSAVGAKAMCLRKIGNCISFAGSIFTMLFQIVIYFGLYLLINILGDRIKRWLASKQYINDSEIEENKKRKEAAVAMALSKEPTFEAQLPGMSTPISKISTPTLSHVSSVSSISTSSVVSSVDSSVSTLTSASRTVAPTRIAVSGIHVVYPNNTHAVRGVSMDLKEGEIVALCARNGGGKSSLMGTFTGQSPMTRGSITVDDHVIKGMSGIVGGKVAITPQQDVYWPNLSALDHVCFFSLLHGVVLKRDEAMTILKSVGLADSCDKPAKKLSGGMKRRLTLACSLSTVPSIVLADEPCSGLDPSTRSSILSVLEIAAESSCVLLSTHTLGDAEDVCDHIVLMSRGTVVKQGGSTEMKEELGGGYMIEISENLKRDQEEEERKEEIMSVGITAFCTELYRKGWKIMPKRRGYVLKEISHSSKKSKETSGRLGSGKDLRRGGEEEEVEEAHEIPNSKFVLRISNLSLLVKILPICLDCKLEFEIRETNLEDVMEHVETATYEV